MWSVLPELERVDPIVVSLTFLRIYTLFLGDLILSSVPMIQKVHV